MEVVIIVTIVLLVFIVITLMLYNISIHKKIASFNNINDKINALKVLQNFMDTIGQYSAVDEKIKRINEIILEKYEVLKYSTIVVFNGAEYILKATNVEEKHWETLRSLAGEEIFKDSIATATPKYVTVDNQNEQLPYQKVEFGRAKSAMFFPLYIDNVFIGFWLIESGLPHAFDKVDTAIIEVIRDNIITIIKAVQYQNTVENIVREDQFTGLKSAEYLYGEGKNFIDQYTISTVCMFQITNIEKINQISRGLGNDVITEVSEIIQENISKAYLFVRYMGPKFVIVFSGIVPDDVTDFIEEIKEQIEDLVFEEEPENQIKVKEPKKLKEISPKLNFVMTSYYKGTSMDGVTKKLEEYLNSANQNESDINYI